MAISRDETMTQWLVPKHIGKNRQEPGNDQYDPSLGTTQGLSKSLSKTLCFL
jgi:hypothetical protein